ncbi:NADH-quinone oxidoreductase subunit NuoF [Paradesulfitobacterium ferrireducens]|uniref:NADH-quinone oxidoreductase subunit NuoF n=1 Tax=Paradesulfitobacterium ferrireducens TaxID=2816476 RepID=UPI001A90734B|nr:NADH-quinone oxidoreductase subunit NuoF [Paradesulfitobacterium ferrireducens]
MKGILVCGGTGCISNNSRLVHDAIEKELSQQGLEAEFELKYTGCHGFCEMGPLVLITPEEEFYCRVKPEDVPNLIDSLKQGKVYEELLYVDPTTKEKIKTRHDVPFYQKQQRLVLKNCGIIDPENIDDYINSGGYKSLHKVLTTMQPEEVIQEIKASGLRGRGGGGFPTGIKWEFARKSTADKKYIICNADEGDPGAFMDRSISEGDPHAVLEGMLIGGYAIGAWEGYIYIRAEYPLAVKRLSIAIEQAEAKGYLGQNILGSDFSFSIKIKQGAGAFVCGEETALMESIQGNRGMPRPRPPYPAVKGLWDRPTNINNVETFANVPVIIGMGSEQYSQIGTEKSKGTKIFALTGKLNNTGLAEVPMGITLREIVFDIGGGISGGKKFKAVQIGGPSGGCLTEEHLDLPIDYDSLLEAGAMMGSGGLVVMDESTCMVELARFFLSFTRHESCGKCTPCREGNTRLLEILQRIVDGKGEKEDLERLQSLGENIIMSSICGLGQTAPNPILSTLKFFRHEYELHVEKKICPAGVCKGMISYKIIEEKCKACGICKKNCPVEAIAGEKKQPHKIDPAKCAQCGVCMEKCPFEAIIRG